MSSLSFAISTIGRPTLLSTIESIVEAREFATNDVEICIFANGSLDKEISKKLEEFNSKYENFIYVKSGTKLPIWESRREGLRLAQKDFVWILGDDDLILPGAITELFAVIEKTNPQLISLNGIWTDYKGKSGPLVKSNAGNFASNDLSKILLALNASMNTLDVGRVVVSRAINLLWASQPGTFDETWHEEYRALYTAISEYISKKQSFLICELEPPAVALGRIRKSWSDFYMEARLGQIRMLENLPENFAPAKTTLSSREKGFYFSFRHQVSLRIRYPGKAQTIDGIQLEKNQAMNVWLAGLVPRAILNLLKRFVY